jgi:predicted DNA-binding protein YlxM (UPF0122 family)
MLPPYYKCIDYINDEISKGKSLYNMAEEIGVTRNQLYAFKRNTDKCPNLSLKIYEKIMKRKRVIEKLMLRKVEENVEHK